MPKPNNPKTKSRPRRKRMPTLLPAIVLAFLLIPFFTSGSTYYTEAERESTSMLLMQDTAEPEEQTRPSEYLDQLDVLAETEIEDFTDTLEGEEIEISDDSLDYEYEEEEEAPYDLVTITISAVGDMTLGGDPRGLNFFIREFENNDQDHAHFLRYVSHIFQADDLTLANLEGTLTYATTHRDREFVFRGPPHFARILSSSGVDAVSIANNHTMDFYERGYRDTIASLVAENIAYFGNDYTTIIEINGIKVGLFGLSIWSYSGYGNRIRASIENLQERGAQLIIAFYHWGIEGSNEPRANQRRYGQFSIDHGAHLVLGAHPHVIQGIEEYNGWNIVYSLANFSFGGNNHPADQDTFIFQQTFTFQDGVLLETNDTNIIPALISSERERNNFQPIVAEGEDVERILDRIARYSEALNR